MQPNETPPASDFIRDFVAADLAAGRTGGRVMTRFPPEPNGYLHIGHAKSIALNFGIAAQFGGVCNLRFDDTNPTTEDMEYVESIQNDVRWLGYDWADRLYFASDFYGRIHEFALELVRKGKAYVCDLNADQTREYRGTLTQPGKDSPGRARSVDENLDLFARMRAGEFPDGSRSLRAKIDMASPNVNLRDPVLYRIKRTPHYRTGTQWLIYPTYDFAHGYCDAIEGVTHSICTLEFEAHRPLYDWLLENVDATNKPDRPRQFEFARLNLTYTVMSKRRLLELVEGKYVHGWDDPRMPTLSGMRRRGYPPEAIRAFCDKIGVTKFNGTTDLALLEHCIRDHLNRTAPRVMGVLRPLRIVLENYPEGQTEDFEVANNPEDPTAGMRKVPFSRVILIERDDFREDPPKEFFRLAPGREVRLRAAYLITCKEAVKDPATGEIVELRCRYDPATRGGDAPDKRKVKATLHWVSAAHAQAAEVRLYDHLFTKADPGDVPEGHDYKENLNPGSLEVLRDARVEPGAAGEAAGRRFQFERLGYFTVDPDSKPGAPVFNRTVTLKDTWAKVEQAAKGKEPARKK